MDVAGSSPEYLPASIELSSISSSPFSSSPFILEVARMRLSGRGRSLSPNPVRL